MNAYICTPWGIIEVKDVTGQQFGSASTVANILRGQTNVAFVDTKAFPVVIDDKPPDVHPYPKSA